MLPNKIKTIKKHVRAINDNDRVSKNIINENSPSTRGVDPTTKKIIKTNKYRP